MCIDVVLGLDDYSGAVVLPERREMPVFFLHILDRRASDEILHAGAVGARTSSRKQVIVRPSK